MNTRELQACADRLEEFLIIMLASVGRSERRHHGSLYVQGLLLDGERKSIEPLAERVPEGNVQALQRFVGQSPLGVGTGPPFAGAAHGGRVAADCGVDCR